jgi:hypothetical protein
VLIRFRIYGILFLAQADHEHDSTWGLKIINTNLSKSLGILYLPNILCLAGLEVFVKRTISTPMCPGIHSETTFKNSGPELDRSGTYSIFYVQQ